MSNSSLVSGLSEAYRARVSLVEDSRESLKMLDRLSEICLSKAFWGSNRGRPWPMDAPRLRVPTGRSAEALGARRPRRRWPHRHRPHLPRPLHRPYPGFISNGLLIGIFEVDFLDFLENFQAS